MPQTGNEFKELLFRDGPRLLEFIQPSCPVFALALPAHHLELPRPRDQEAFKNHLRVTFSFLQTLLLQHHRSTS
jgi:hypothetical protein